jgi:hypothetical protein
MAPIDVSLSEFSILATPCRPGIGDVSLSGKLHKVSRIFCYINMGYFADRHSQSMVSCIMEDYSRTAAEPNKRRVAFHCRMMYELLEEKRPDE